MICIDSYQAPTKAFTKSGCASTVSVWNSITSTISSGVEEESKIIVDPSAPLFMDRSIGFHATPCWMSLDPM